MTPKVEWFQEILTQEPNSRVFFPLAKLLSEAGDTKQALITLQKGLEHHPDFLEARLFLIHLLYGVGDMESCSSELLRIANLFNEYPNFWIAWGKTGIQSGGEFGLYMALMSTLVMNPGLTLWEFLSRGLTSLSEKSSYTPSINDMKNMLNAKQSEKDDQNVLSESFQKDNVVAEEDTCMLCTRSMAEILAEQGDISGAIKIYQVLEEQAISIAEKASLREEITKLSDAVNDSLSSELFTDVDDIDFKGEVIGMLESLASRLEERIRA